MIEKKKIQEISDKIRGIVENSPISDIEDNINALLQGAFTKMGLVNREEFDIQTQVLKRTRAKLEALEEKLAGLKIKPKK
ncbi:MAG: accessory factor UbiK family protein [Proteobacteria bacterium]|jgi:ubiquinone biosynthesis accessory factor UbiK|nr:accessory factor UbiK family protein [Pseudomonadota bacterium]|tara:strand:+ start:1038 stop:1277 length:240 start_codon:yes stop_codon:yes gene_type:complete